MKPKTPRQARRAQRQRATRLLATCLVAALLGCTAPSDGPTAAAGVLDLSAWDFGTSGNVTLAGDWAVCWGRLLEPSESECPGTGWKTIQVPGLWSEPSSGSPFGGHGVATYRLRILLPASEQRLELYAGAPLTSSRLWIDGVAHAGTGVVGETAATASADPRRNRRAELVAGGEVELLVQLASFEFRGGGIRRPWVIGRPDAIEAMAGRMVLREALLFGVGVLVGLAYLLQFAIRPSDRARGYFGMVTLMLGLRAVPASISDFGPLLVPWASFDLIVRLEYAGLALVVFSGAGYFLLKVPGVMPPRTIRGVQDIALALVPVTLLAPFELVLETLVFYFVLPPLVIGIVIVSYGRAWWRGRPGVASTLVASLLYLAVIAHDLLRTFEAGRGTSIELFPYFVVMWILNEASEGIQVFNRTFTRVESLSGELADANFELQETESAVARFVPFDLLRLIGRESIQDIEAGDRASREMSVLCCEIRGDAGTRDRSDPAVAFEVLAALVDRLEPLVYHREGFVAQYGGHGLLALFPRSPEDALAAATEMAEEVERFRPAGGGASAPGPRFRACIGISTGPVLVGTIGGDQHCTSGVFGEVVVEAQRIAALARATGASPLVMASTRERLGDAAGWRFGDAGRLKAGGGSSSGGEAANVFEATRVRVSGPVGG